MATITIPIASREQWLTDRAQDITSTEIAALWNLSPYVTHFELWHRKHSGASERFEPNARIVWGTRLQDAIAAGIAEDRGWHVRRIDEYMRDPEERIGSSFDFEVVSSEHGRGLMEIKNVDWLIFRDEWTEGADGLEAPQHIEMQVQHQMEVADLPWCALVVLVGGNDAHVVIRLRDREIGRAIRSKAREFWRSIAENRQPVPEYSLDAEFLCSLYGRADDGVVMEADTETAELLAEYERLGKAEAQRKEIKARVLERIGRASKVITPAGSLSVGMVKASPGTLITPAMVGTHTGAREGFRMFRYTPKKEKAQ